MIEKELREKVRNIFHANNLWDEDSDIALDEIIELVKEACWLKGEQGIREVPNFFKPQEVHGWELAMQSVKVAKFKPCKEWSDEV